METPAFASSARLSNAYDAGDIFSASVVSNGPRRMMLRAEPEVAIKGILQNAMAMKPTRRFVQVLVVDPHPDLPLDKCVLHKGEEKMTDLDDQELFFELDIKKLLDEHNAKRTKVQDKKIKDRVEYLEPARIRDLKMHVVEIASF